MQKTETDKAVIFDFVIPKGTSDFAFSTDPVHTIGRFCFEVEPTTSVEDYNNMYGTNKAYRALKPPWWTRLWCWLMRQMPVPPRNAVASDRAVWVQLVRHDGRALVEIPLCKVPSGLGSNFYVVECNRQLKGFNWKFFLKGTGMVPVSRDTRVRLTILYGRTDEEYGFPDIHPNDMKNF